MQNIIYTKANCIQCSEAKKLMDNAGLSYEERYIVSEDDMNNMFEHVGRTVRSLPQIFFVENNKENYVGGLTELKQKLVNA